MTCVSVADLAKHFGRWRDPAPREPVTFTPICGETLILPSADENLRHCYLDDRRSCAPHEIPSSLLGELKREAPACTTGRGRAVQCRLP